jgi:hypothetical protein
MRTHIRGADMTGVPGYHSYQFAADPVDRNLSVKQNRHLKIWPMSCLEMGNFEKLNKLNWLLVISRQLTVWSRRQMVRIEPLLKGNKWQLV